MPSPVFWKVFAPDSVPSSTRVLPAATLMPTPVPAKVIVRALTTLPLAMPRPVLALKTSALAALPSSASESTTTRPPFRLRVPKKSFVAFASTRVPVPVFVKPVPVSLPCAVSVWTPATSIRAVPVEPPNVIVRCVAKLFVTMPRAPLALIVTALPASPSAASALITSRPPLTVIPPAKLFVALARTRVPVSDFVKPVPMSWPCAVSVWEPATSICAVAAPNVIVRCVAKLFVTMPRAPLVLIVTVLPESPRAASLLMASRPLFRMMPDVAMNELVPVRVCVFPLFLTRPPVVPMMLPEKTGDVPSPRRVNTAPLRLTVPEPERPPTVWANVPRSNVEPGELR